MYQEFEKSKSPAEVKSDIKELLFSEITKGFSETEESLE